MSPLRTTLRRLRAAARRAWGLDIRFPAEVAVPVERHGNDAGEWWVCSDGLNAGSIVYSIGIGTDISFDLSLIRTFGLTVHAFDPTPGALEFVQQQAVPPGFVCHPIGVGARDGTATFFPPENPRHISHTLIERPATSDRAIQVEIRRLSTIMRDLDHDRIDVLKMDIEGAEYDVLDEVLTEGLPIRQLLVEFHHRFPGVGVERTRRAVHALHSSGYRICFAADSGEEYSFIRV